MSVEPSSAVWESASFEARNAGYRQIIQRFISEHKLSLNHLYKIGAIRNRKTFEKKLEAGDLTSCELDRLFTVLQLDPVRAHVAIITMADPDAYFDTTCETALRIATALTLNLREQAAACEGDFEPIRENLCNAIAVRACNLVMEQQARIRDARDYALQSSL